MKKIGSVETQKCLDSNIWFFRFYDEDADYVGQLAVEYIKDELVIHVPERLKGSVSWAKQDDAYSFTVSTKGRDGGEA